MANPGASAERFLWYSFTRCVHEISLPLHCNKTHLKFEIYLKFGNSDYTYPKLTLTVTPGISNGLN